jgi:hypothetical protein
VRIHERLAQPGDSLPGRLADRDLARVGAAVVADGDGLAAPDQLGARAAEVAPAPLGELGRLARLGAIPPLHRQDAETVADAQAVGFERLRERAPGRGERLIELERNPSRLQMAAEGRRVA